MKDNYNIEELEKAKKRFDFIFSNGKKERLCIPTVDMYYKIMKLIVSLDKFFIDGLKPHT